MRYFLCALLLLPAAVPAQGPLRVRVLSAADSSAVPNALVRAGDATGRTGADGLVLIEPTGLVDSIRVSRIGFSAITVAAGQAELTVFLTPAIEGMIIAATRSERRIEDDPLRVEVLEKEEVEEKLRMTPGDITMMMNETPGLRVQTTSPSLGGANVRVQGMRGRYTQILSDGLPLFGSQTGGLGLLQIPPMDLAGVEVIKGVASALYGGNALGGVINLRSREPGPEPIGEALINQSVLGGTDLVGFSAAQMDERWGGSVLAGYHLQERRDVDDDGWTDMPKYERAVVRPRLFWTSEHGHGIMLTGGMTDETRSGGSMPGHPGPGGGPAYIEALSTRRYDGGGVGRWIFGETLFSMRGSSAHQSHRHGFGPVMERDVHRSSFAEAAATRLAGTASLTAGVALQLDEYRNSQAPDFDFRFTVPGVFGQATFDPAAHLSLTASARYDDHSEYGGQFSPRISALMRAPAGVTLRLSAGEGYFAPTPLTEETEVTGLTPVSRDRALVAERARTMSADIGRAFGYGEANLTVFGSEIRRPVAVIPATDPLDVVEGRTLRLVNASGPTSASGVDAVLRLKPEHWHITMSYTFTDATEIDAETGASRRVPLTPRHQGGFVSAWEGELTRVGVEIYYTGRQSLHDNPYRTESKPYTHLGLLAERRFGRARVWLNAENLLGVRQTETDRLVRPTRGPGGRWTTDVWAPLEGRTANVGVRWDLFHVPGHDDEH